MTDQTDSRLPCPGLYNKTTIPILMQRFSKKMTTFKAAIFLHLRNLIKQKSLFYIFFLITPWGVVISRFSTFVTLNEEPV